MHEILVKIHRKIIEFIECMGKIGVWN